MKRAILLPILIGGCIRSPYPAPNPEEDGIFVILQASKRVAIIDRGSKSVEGYVQTGEGDIPNYLLFRNDTMFVINSGGFTGAPSITLIDMNTWETMKEIPLPSGSNPLQGILIGDTLVMTDFGKHYSENLLLLNLRTETVDSLKLAPRPINIVEGIFATANGMDENYNYAHPSRVFALDEELRKIDSISLSPGSGGIEVQGDTLFFLSSGIPGERGSTLYLLNPADLNLLDSIAFEENLYSLGVSDSRIVIGDFFGKLYILDRALNLVDTLRPGYTINCIKEDEGVFYITINGYSSGNPNYLLILEGSHVDSILVSDGDEGIYCPFPFKFSPAS